MLDLSVGVQVMKMGEKLQGLQEEKHQLFLQLKKVLHEEEKRRRKEQRSPGDPAFETVLLKHTVRSCCVSCVFAVTSQR